MPNELPNKLRKILKNKRINWEQLQIDVENSPYFFIHYTLVVSFDDNDARKTVVLCSRFNN